MKGIPQPRRTSLGHWYLTKHPWHVTIWQDASIAKAKVTVAAIKVVVMTDGDTDDRAHVPTGQLATLPHCPLDTHPHCQTATLPTGQQLASISLRLHLRHSLYWSWCKCNANLAKYPQKFAQLCARGSVLHCNFSQSVWSIRARVVCSCHKKLHAVRRNYAKGSVCIVFPT